MSKNNKDEYIPDISDLIITKADKKCQCPYCDGFDAGMDAGIDAHWDWVRTALFRIVGERKLIDAKFINELQNTIEDVTVTEVKEFLEM